VVGNSVQRILEDQSIPGTTNTIIAIIIAELRGVLMMMLVLYEVYQTSCLPIEKTKL
jgi:hypothetical protein